MADQFDDEDDIERELATVVDDFREEMHRNRILLVKVKEELVSCLETIARADGEPPEGLSLVTRELEGTLLRVFEIERSYDYWDERAGPPERAAASEFDIGALRAAIGRKLDRLRDAADPGPVS